MALGNITYQTLVDVVKSWIKSNCTNITNYNGISNSVKNGYSYTVGYCSSGVNFSETVTASSSSSISSVSSSTVDTDMNNFLSSIGASSFLSSNITPDNFYKFMNDMVCFCCTKCAFVSNQYNNSSASSVKYMVYYAGNTSYNYKQNISASTATALLAKASDVNTLLQYIVNLTTQNLRVISCRYSYNINGVYNTTSV